MPVPRAMVNSPRAITARNVWSARLEPGPLTPGYADHVMLRHGLNETGAAFIPKPYGIATLSAKIREVLAQK